MKLNKIFAAIFLTVAVFYNGTARANPTPTAYLLQNQLFLTLSQTYPNATCISESGVIETICLPSALPAAGKPAPTYDSFQAALLAAFQSDANLTWAANQAALTADAGTVAAYFFGGPANPLPVRLAQAIYTATVAAGVPPKLAAQEEYNLAYQCLAVRGRTDLYNQLNTALANDASLGLKPAECASISFSVVQVVQTDLPARGYKPHDMTMTDTNANGRWRLAFSTGAEVTTPYSIQVPPNATGTNFGTLSNNGNNTVAYLQLELMRHWVLSPTFSPNPNNDFVDGFTFRHPIEADWSPNYDLVLGFLPGNSPSGTNGSTAYSASTLAGSDINMQATIGIPLWRNNWQNKDQWPVEISFASSLGLTTSLQFEKIHAKEFLGGTVDIGLPYGVLNGSNNTGYVEFKIGEGHLDVPKMTGSNNQVFLDDNGIPQFKNTWSPQMGVRALVPLGTQLYLDLESDAFFTGNPPNQWDVKVGVTIPFATLGSTLKFLGTPPQ